MADPTAPTVTTRTPTGADVDLVAEDLRLPDGSRLTAELADQITTTVRRTAGRPSLTGTAASSPQITFRVTPAVRERATRMAAEQSKTLSELAREALEQRVTAG